MVFRASSGYCSGIKNRKTVKDRNDDYHGNVGSRGVDIDWSASVHDPAVQSELRSALSAAIDELPAAHRAVFLLHDVDRVSMAEVADSLGITVMTAKSRAHRARLFLRKRLSIFMSGPNDGARPREEPAGSQRHHNSEEAGAERHVNHVST